MFVKKDTRKVVEILYDAKDERKTLRLGRREAEFGGTTNVLCDAANGPRLTALTSLSLYGNKIARLTHFSTLATHATRLEELDVRVEGVRPFTCMLAPPPTIGPPHHHHRRLDTITWWSCPARWGTAPA